MNAAISASVVLASRLSSNLAVFALILFSVQLFALYPFLRMVLEVRNSARTRNSTEFAPEVPRSSLDIHHCRPCMPFRMLECIPINYRNIYFCDYISASHLLGTSHSDLGPETQKVCYAVLGCHWCSKDSFVSARSRAHGMWPFQKSAYDICANRDIASRPPVAKLLVQLLDDS